MPRPPVAWSMKTLDPVAFRSKRGDGAGEGDGDVPGNAATWIVASRIAANTANRLCSTSRRESASS